MRLAPGITGIAMVRGALITARGTGYPGPCTPGITGADPPALQRGVHGRRVYIVYIGLIVSLYVCILPTHTTLRDVLPVVVPVVSTDNDKDTTTRYHKVVSMRPPLTQRHPMVALDHPNAWDIHGGTLEAIHPC